MKRLHTHVTCVCVKGYMCAKKPTKKNKQGDWKTYSIVSQNAKHRVSM